MAVVRILLLTLIISTTAPAGFFGQTLETAVASHSDGQNTIYFETLHEAVALAAGVSIYQPDEITVLTDIILNEPLVIVDGVHIRLVAGEDITIRRGGNQPDYPVIWVRGENASLSLGKPNMEYVMIIDGGYQNSTPKNALAPLVVVGGLDSILIVHDNVTLQNNYGNAGFKTPHRILIIVIIFSVISFAAVFIIVWKNTFKKRMEEVFGKNPVSEFNLEDLDITPYEMEMCKLLLTELPLKQIAHKLGITYSGVTYHAQSLYRKLGIRSRPELFVKLVIKNEGSKP